ncbi:hypothetical protein V5O48_004841 [Marasmius crinis-equi]|uniref:Uncharacterized protein n=1 Tax=Marasmius crinis-equi TaxID=585013 RepID=A0ABR3FP48_9AGAR
MVRCCRKCHCSAFLRPEAVEEGLLLREERYGVRYGRELWEIFPHYHGNTDGPDSRLFLIEGMVEVLSEYDFLTQEGKTLSRRLWMTRELQTVVARRKYINECRRWEDARKRERKQELEGIKDERFQAIVRKFEDLGWAEVLGDWELRATLREHRLVNQPRALTDRSTSSSKHQEMHSLNVFHSLA